MKIYEMAAIILAVVIILLIFHFITVKGSRKRISIVNADGKQISLDVEIADSLTTRAKGLMGRKSLGEYEGMLFVFDRPGIYQLWMLNTTIPLDAIYISDDGTIVEIIEMDPCGLNVIDCKLYKPKSHAKYVLEVKQGFSKKHNIKTGSSTVVTHFQ